MGEPGIRGADGDACGSFAAIDLPEGMRGIPPLQRLPISCFLMLVPLRGMSEENVERRAAMQRGTEAFNRRDVEGLIEELDAEIEYDAPSSGAARWRRADLPRT